MNKHKKLQKKRLKRAIKEGRVVIIPVDDMKVFYDAQGNIAKSIIAPVNAVVIGTGENAEMFELLPNPEGNGIRVIRGANSGNKKEKAINNRYHFACRSGSQISN